jgi:hypothetical protein
MLYWLTASGASSARLYWESMFEQPELFVNELHAFFRLVR